MKTLIIENNWLTRMPGMLDFGWGNGYVLIPEGHKLHGKTYGDIDVNIHGGLTYSDVVTQEIVDGESLPQEDLGKWMVGFDTAHYGDSLDAWSKEDVQKEADLLLKRLSEL